MKKIIEIYNKIKKIFKRDKLLCKHEEEYLQYVRGVLCCMKCGRIF